MNNSKLLLAADSGGTKTDWLVFDRSGKVHARHKTAGLAMLHPGLLDCQSAAGEIGSLSHYRPKAIYLSLGGPNTAEVQTLLSELFPHSTIAVEREANGNMILFAASFLGCQAAVMVGTGSTAMGEVDGRRVFAGGWGPVYGDEGAGCGIGFQALHCYLRSLDGMENSGQLAEIFSNLTDGLDYSMFSDRMKLKARVNSLDRRQLASLAPEIYALAEAGDAVADSIFEIAARENARLAGAVTSKGLPGKILGCGGLFQLGAKFREKCEKHLFQLCPLQRWVWKPEFSPVHAAMLMLLNIENREMDSVLFQKVMMGEE